jgi:hypothetical protein
MGRKKPNKQIKLPQNNEQNKQPQLNITRSVTLIVAKATTKLKETETTK